MSEVIYERAAETAKKIRKALKEAFPETKFSVRSSTYSMGSSVHVSWTDGQMYEEVESVLNRFKSGHFDGIQDMYVSGSYEYEGKRYCGAKYVDGNRTMSPEYKEQVQAFCDTVTHEGWRDDYDTYYWMKRGERIMRGLDPVPEVYTEDDLSDEATDETDEGNSTAATPDLLQPTAEQSNGKIISFAQARAAKVVDWSAEQRLMIHCVRQFTDDETIAFSLAKGMTPEQLFKIAAEAAAAGVEQL